MKNTKGYDENRREHMRVRARLHFCISVIEGVNHETSTFNYGACFCTATSDVSLGGICVTHDGSLKPGAEVEISTPEKMTQMACLSCEKAFLYKNELDLEPIYGRVRWVTNDRCGIEFIKLAVRNENILSKYIWEEHLSSVRSKKAQVVRQKKF